MSARNRLVLIVVMAALAVLSACTTTNKATPPPTGGFSNTNLNGTYVFSTSGNDSNATTPEFIAMVGTFTACGCTGGTISAAGFVDVNDPNLPAPVVQDAITGGSYAVGVDGRGKVSLTLATPLPAPFPSGTITLKFVLSSSQGGLVTEFDNNGSGSGTLDLQNSPAQTAGTYVFNLGGIAGVSVTSPPQGIPLATVGSVTLDASGNVTTPGVQDLNNNGADSLLSITTSSTVLVGTSPTKATLVTSVGTFTFDVYAIDSAHFKLIETDAAPILVGDVFSQSSSSFPSGELAFTMAGVDIAAGGPLAVGGMMNSAGANVTGVEDFNDAGVSNITSTSSAPVAFTGGFASSGGRYVVTFNAGFENGNGGNATVPYTFAAYPSTGGTQFLEIDGVGITDGVALPQNSTSFASGQGYGLNLTASNSGGFEEDDIAEFTNTNGTLTGLIDVNDEGATSNPQNFGATHQADSNNPGRALIGSNTSATPNLVSYTVDSATTIFIEIDSSQVGLGSIGQQASAAQGAIAHMAVMHQRPIPRAAGKKKAADDRNK